MRDEGSPPEGVAGGRDAFETSEADECGDADERDEAEECGGTGETSVIDETSDERAGSRTDSRSRPRRLLYYVSLFFEAVAVAVVGAVTRRVGRDDSLWVFGARGGTDFCENSKYLYLSVAADKPDVRPVWVTKNRAIVRELQAHGYEAYHAFSPRGIWLQLRAGTVFLTHNLKDVNRFAVGGATLVMLWHGVPLKRISWDAELAERPRPVQALSRYLYDQYDLVSLTGSGAREAFRTGFGLPDDRLVVTGYPRTDVFFESVPGATLCTDETELDRIRRLADDHDVWLYMPTFREDPSAQASEHVDFAALDAVLAERDAYLVVKLHPKERLDADLSAFDRLLELPAGVDVYPLLPATDGLITDYSSVLFDYLLLDRPVIRYAYDLEVYRAERGFYYDYEELSPGPTAREFDELLDALATALDGDDDHAAERRAVRDRFFDENGGGYADAVYEAVRELRG
ncbi:CDP-glycerol glycerophosphotransferase family protein [Haloprofundus salilacus]|uniref:CDP-glycerol glycerophosphotransferase family protein n=1 Tax=Haloprofundus salilacus TaxID=2876190 RepID=UPI001CCD2B17|nr:CDP-glycerol glycerophosphotransferase family protein [Haloprofundus salilacus]